MVRAAFSVRKFGRGVRAFAPHFRSATRPRHRGLRPDRPLLCGESSARRSGNPGRRRAFSRKPRSTTAVCDRNFDRSPRFPTATSVAKTATAARICFERGAGLSPCARNTMREEIGRDTSSSQHAGHAVRRNRTRSAAGTFSGHRQRSRRICHQRCGWPSLSDDERLVEEHARSRGVEEKQCSTEVSVGRPQFAVGNRGDRSKFRSQTAVVDRGLRLKARRADRGSRRDAPGSRSGGTETTVARTKLSTRPSRKPGRAGAAKPGRAERTLGAKVRCAGPKLR